MRLCRFDDDRLGVVEGDVVIDVTPALELLPAIRWPAPAGDILLRHLAAVTEAAARLKPTGQRRAVADVRLASPIANPTKIMAAPVNYRKHHAEAEADPATFHAHHVRKIEETGLFLKATSSLVGAGDGVRLRHLDRRNDHEVELAVIVGRTADRVAAADALGHVAAYAIGLDMTVRGPEERSMRKSCDSYTVLGPWLVTADEIADPTTLDLEITVNGAPRQKANTRDLVVGIPELIAWASQYYTLHPGDILLTGTPEGVGPVLPGDEMIASIAGIGTMRVAVTAA
jgi:2-keto-4-pentenoate hydratase/2-oxohepta-3-ene-1,7-dioic acid hydratase in catechol pathway